MKKLFSICLAVLYCFAPPVSAQIPVRALVQISRAEDELRFDETLGDLMKSGNARIRARAALASGRIGREDAIAPLTDLLEKDSDANARGAAAFALGEIESIKGADAILRALQNTNQAGETRARAVEAAGKIAAANPKDEKSKPLGAAILNAMQIENERGAKQNRTIILLAITAILRAKPDGGDSAAAKFLTNADGRIRSDAANTLSRLRSKIADETLRAMLLSDKNPNARANAARALGAAEDQGAFDILLKASATDTDSRVRVSAIRSLGSLKDARAAGKLLSRGENLLNDYKKSKFANPFEKNELLEIATTLGRILPNTNNENAIKFLQNLREIDKFRSPETEIAFAQISSKTYLNSKPFVEPKEAHFGFSANLGVAFAYANGLSGFAQALSEIADNKSADKETLEKAREQIEFLYRTSAGIIILANPEVTRAIQGDSSDGISEKDFESLKKNLINGFPDILRAIAKLKPEGYQAKTARFLMNKTVMIGIGSDGKKYAIPFKESANDKEESPYRLFNKDAIVRATAAELLGETTEINSAPALSAAFDFAVGEDKELNDAQIAILDAIVKQNKEQAKKVFAKALDSPDFLVRRHAAQLIKQNDLTKDFPNADEKVGTVKPHNPQTGTKLGQILNAEADYVRAVSRSNARAILTTEKGSFTIEFFPEDAPLTVDNFIKLARAKYFDGLQIHRVVPNFVVQDGDPRGDGNGSPGWEIRDEINMKPYERGTVGMALSGKDTGGSQWFVTHAPQPHLDGGYTVFGKVNETDMKIVDNLTRGDKILSVKIVEGNLPRKDAKAHTN